MPGNKIFFRICLIMAMLLVVKARMSAQSLPDSVSGAFHAFTLPETDSVRMSALDAVLGHYNDWETIEMTGKLRASGLPLNPTVRLYMAKGKELSLSVRAPFVGEAGRLEIFNDTLTAVNRMKRVYCRESLRGILDSYPGFISDLQSLLLGRIVVVGAGELSFVNAALMEVSSAGKSSLSAGDSEGWRFEQQGLDRMVSGLSLAYITEADGRLRKLELNVELPRKEGEEEAPSVSVGLHYSYPDSGLDITIVKGEPEREIAVLDFNSIKWSADRPSPVKLGDRFRQVGIKDFFKSF